MTQEPDRAQKVRAYNAGRLSYHTILYFNAVILSLHVVKAPFLNTGCSRFSVDEGFDACSFNREPSPAP